MSSYLSIITANINNSSSAKSSIGLKISGKGLNDNSNANNNYDNNGIGFELLSNTSNYKELAIINTSNLSGLSIITNDKSIMLKTSNKPLIINSNLFINNSNIGIGITNPQSSLHIKGNITLNGTININNTQWSNTNNNVYYNQGYIGIGITNPQSLVHLSSLSQSLIKMDNFTIGKDSNQNGLLWNYDNYSSNLIFGTSNQEILRITSNGRIGATNPLTTIDIRGNLILNGTINNSALNNINLWSNANNKLYYSQGFLGIGITNPQSLVHLSDSQSFVKADNFTIGKDSNQNGLLWNYDNYSNLIFGTSNQERLRITSNGRIGIGTTNPLTSIDIRSNVNINGNLIINNTIINPTVINSNVFYYSNQELNISNFNLINYKLPITTCNINNISATNNSYLLITSNTTIQINNSIYTDLLLVGGGGNGGYGGYSGGGGAGEVIYYPNYPFLTGIYNLKVGIGGTTDINNRISKLTFNNSDIIKANGGGDGCGAGISVNISGSGTYSGITQISTTNDYYVMFTSGTSTITFNNSYLCDLLIVGGGGSGGGGAVPNTYDITAGGGAGCVIHAQNITITPNSYSITIGNGGVPVNNGQNTTAFGFTAYGGGYGGKYHAVAGNAGGSGGGGGNVNGNYTFTANGGASTKGITSGLYSGIFYGNTGGGGGGWASGSTGGGAGGGGGAGAVGSNGVFASSAGGGGDGVQINITGINYYWGGGGGGALVSSGGNAGNGGKGGGGAGSTESGRTAGIGDSNGINFSSNVTAGSAASSGAPNTGGGGGGGFYNGNAGSGGSGVVIIKFKNIIQNPTSGGSGGGSYLTNSGALAGTPNNENYSLITSGKSGSASQGGSGGSALSAGGFSTTITGSSLTVGTGGSGATSSTTPAIKTNYGDGGDGNGGLGAQGVIIMRFPTTANKYLSITNNFTEMSNIQVSGNIYTSNSSNNFTLLDNYWTKSSINANNIYYSQGNIGIGTVRPQYKLDVIGDVNITGSYYRNNTILSYTGSGTYIFSDSRIKTNIIDINDNSALQQILKIEPKIYNYIDKAERGTDTVYGFIAQQIREVIPEAVKIQTDFIPNIYKWFDYDYYKNQIITNEDLTAILRIGDRIKIRDNNQDYYRSAIIINITTTIIIIDLAIYGDRCFIYGKEINDFHYLDKSYIYTLGVCATQDLYKMLQGLNDRYEQQQLKIRRIKELLLIRQ